MTADLSLRRMLLLSMAGHLAVLAVVFLQAIVFPGAPISLPQAIRVDVVGLPQKLQDPSLNPAAKTDPAPPKPKAKLPPKEVAPPPPTKAPAVPLAKNKKTDRAEAQRKILERLKNDQARNQALDAIKDSLKEKEQAPATTVAGNKVSEGNSLTGLERVEFDRYLDELTRRFNRNFEIPQWLADANLSAEVVVLIDERGYVTRKTMKRPSPNQVFNDIVMGTIEKTSPVPAPPDRLRARLATMGITVKFPK